MEQLEPLFSTDTGHVNISLENLPGKKTMDLDMAKQGLSQMEAMNFNWALKRHGLKWALHSVLLVCGVLLMSPLRKVACLPRWFYGPMGGAGELGIGPGQAKDDRLVKG